MRADTHIDDPYGIGVATIVFLGFIGGTLYHIYQHPIVAAKIIGGLVAMAIVPYVTGRIVLSLMDKF